MNDKNSTKVAEARGVKSSVVMYPDVKAAIAELRTEWGFRTTSETIAVAVRYLAQVTRKGLARIDFDEPGSPGQR